MMAGVVAVGATLDERARGDDVVVPVPLQMKLLAKVAGYDKNLPARAGDKVRVLVVAKPKNADADRVSGQALAALAEVSEIAGLPVEALAEPFSSGGELKKAIAKRRAAVVYLAPGLSGDEVDGVVAALDGVDVLSATAVPGDVSRGVVLGFDLAASKPKLLVHLARAKRQHVALSAEVLKLAQVIE